MKNQVTSIEQSRRLIGLGVPAEKASMAWAQCSGKYHLSVLPHYTAGKEYIENGESIPAFTVADLLGVLPKKITTPRGKVHMLHIGPCSSTSPCWCLYWGDEDVQIGWQERISFLHLLEDAIEWLLSNGYKLEV